MSAQAQWTLVIGGLLAAACIGSFTCVIIERLPIALSEPDEFGDLYGTRPWKDVLGGTSHCDSCGEPVRPLDLVPIVSWFLLRGRCRFCGSGIPPVHPLVEITVPAITGLLLLARGLTWQVAPALILIPLGVAIAAIDVRTYIVPTRLVWPGFALTLAVSGAVVLGTRELDWLLGGLIGLASLAVPLFVIWFILPSAMGFGDVRLAVLLGWVVGFSGTTGSALDALRLAIAALVVSCVLGIVLGVAVLGARGRRAKVPFGPALVAGTILCVALSDRFLSAFGTG